jgi:hypothetical protein
MLFLNVIPNPCYCVALFLFFVSILYEDISLLSYLSLVRWSAAQ